MEVALEASVAKGTIDSKAMTTLFFMARTDVRSEQVGFLLMGGGVSKRFVLMTEVHSNRWAERITARKTEIGDRMNDRNA